MILSFKHKGLLKLFEFGHSAAIQQQHAKKIRSILAMLNSACDPKEVLHALTSTSGNYSTRDVLTTS